MIDNEKTILIVDDDPDSVEFVEIVISEIGDFAILAAFHGIDGLEMARTELPDLIILDVMMPGTDGFRVFRDLGNDPETEKIPVIILTGVSEEMGLKFSGEHMGKFLGREPEDFIDKPVNPERLQKAIKKALRI